MLSIEKQQQAMDVVIFEGACLDNKDWDNWINLYTEDATYWIPAWDEEHTTTNDPQKEISLIYYGSRAGLEDRVFRIRTGASLASTPLPRTCHMNTNFRFESSGDSEVMVHSSWQTLSYRLKKVTSYFGLQQHLLKEINGQLKIRQRKIILHNDMVDTVLDIYSV